MVALDVLLFIIPILLISHSKVFNLLQSKKLLLLLNAVLFPLLHGFLVGLRWQVSLLYLTHGILLVLALFLLSVKGSYQLGHRGLRKLCAVAVLTTVLFTWTFPIGLLIKPKGPYKIGTENVTLRSAYRRELYGERYDSKREFALQIYYPSDVGGNQPAPLFESGDALAEGFKRAFGIPKFVVGYLSDLPSNAYYDTALSDSQEHYPVVVISHGWKGFKNIHANLAETMASNGYIVVTIDHTYGALATEIDEDKIVYLNRAALPRRNENPHYLKYASALVETYKGDIIETLNYLEGIQASESGSRVSKRLNLEKIAVIGHSTGGGAAVKAALEDQRIAGVVGLDAWVEPMDTKEIITGLKVPYLHLSSQDWMGGVNERNLNMLISNSYADRWLVSLSGTKHSDFTMLGYLSPVSEYIQLSGPNGEESIEIQEKLVFKFIDYYINGRNTKKAIEDIINNYDSATAEAVYMK